MGDQDSRPEQDERDERSEKQDHQDQRPEDEQVNWLAGGSEQKTAPGRDEQHQEKTEHVPAKPPTYRPEPVNEDADPEDWLGDDRSPDVMLSVPDLGVDSINLKVRDLRADVMLGANVLNLVDLNVGASVTLGEVDLDIQNVRGQAMLKVKLDKVVEVVDRVATMLENRPELLTELPESIGKALNQAQAGQSRGVSAPQPDMPPRATRPNRAIEAIYDADYVEDGEPQRSNGHHTEKVEVEHHDDGEREIRRETAKDEDGREVRRETEEVAEERTPRPVDEDIPPAREARHDDKKERQPVG